jgi:hypothetical protein
MSQNSKSEILLFKTFHIKDSQPALLFNIILELISSAVSEEIEVKK